MQKTGNHYLILTSDILELEYLLKGLQKVYLSAILPKTFKENRLFEKIKSSLSQCVLVDSYFDTGEVEYSAIKMYEKNSFNKVIALKENDLLRAGKIRDFLKIEGQTYYSALHYRDKILMKQTLAKSGIRVPQFQHIPSPVDLLNVLQTWKFPVVVKHARETENKKIFILKNQEEVLSLVTTPTFFNHNHTNFLEVEEYIEGTLYHVNGLVDKGEVIYSWPSVYPKPPIRLNEGLPATSHLLEADNPLVLKLNRYARTILKALPTPPQTLFHLEVFVTTSQELIICEIASRLGGKGVNENWIESFGINMREDNLKLQMGETIETPTSLIPRAITGEVWFPILPKVSQTLKNCPFPWVKNHQLESVEHELSSQQNYFGGASLLIASTEKEIIERIEIFSKWFVEIYSSLLLRKENPSSSLPGLKKVLYQAKGLFQKSGF